jgi:hypothetical protein
LCNPEALRVSAKAIKGKRVSYGAIKFVWCAVVSLFGQIVRFFYILLEVEAESCEVGSNRRLGRRAFVQALESAIEFFEIVISTIKPAQRIEGLTAHGRILRDAQP